MKDMEVRSDVLFNVLSWHLLCFNIVIAPSLIVCMCSVWLCALDFDTLEQCCRLHFRPKTPPPAASSEGEDADVDIFNSSQEEPLQCGLPSVDGSTLTLEVETISDDIFINSSTMSSLDNTNSNVTTTELNLSELMSNSYSQLCELPSYVTDDENLNILERLGLGSGSLSSPTDDTKSGILTEDLPRRVDSSSSPPVSGWDTIVGCSKFILYPSSSLRSSSSHDPLSLSTISTSGVTNHAPPSSTPNLHHTSTLHHHSHHHHHHHHRRRHKHHHLSTTTSTSNFLTSPFSSTNNNANISGFNNGGLVLNHEPSTSVSGGFSMAIPSTSASENVLVRASGAASTGFGGGVQNLTNGPISTECKCIA